MAYKAEITGTFEMAFGEEMYWKTIHPATKDHFKTMLGAEEFVEKEIERKGLSVNKKDIESSEGELSILYLYSSGTSVTTTVATITKLDLK